MMTEPLHVPHLIIVQFMFKYPQKWGRKSPRPFRDHVLCDPFLQIHLKQPAIQNNTI